MCRSCAEGGRRCRDVGALRRLNLADLRPAEMVGIPDVDWDVGGHVETELSVLWTLADAVGPGEALELPGMSDVREALGLLVGVCNAERGVTSVLLDCKPDGVRLHGLESRVKSPSSLVRKIHDRVVRSMGSPTAPAKSAAEVADRVNDALRYTMVVKDSDRFVESVHQVVDSLTARGFEVIEADHSFIEDSMYKGLHLVLREPGGLPFELQFHTDASQSVKNQIHLLYEKARMIGIGRLEKANYQRRMMELSSTVPDPPGLEALKSLGGIVVQRRRK